jgi:hypothetical protein
LHVIERVDTRHRARHRREALSEETVVATDAKDTAAVFGGDADEPRMVVRIAMPARTFV